MRLFIDNILADEFELHDWPTITEPSSTNDFLRPGSYLVKENVHDPECEEKFKVVEFDSDKSKLDLLFQVYNNDNNFTNGFMTKSTLVNLNFFYVCDQKNYKLIEELAAKKIQHNTVKKSGVVLDVKNSYRSIKNKKHFLIENFSKKCDLTDLTIGQKIDGSLHAGGGQQYYTFGTDIEYHVSLVKRHRVWMTEQDANHIGLYRPGDVKSLKFLYDKYSQYENQRSSN